MAESEQKNSMGMGGITKKNILSTPALLQYIMETSAYPNEHKQLKEIRDATVEKYANMSLMNVPADEAQFLSMIIKLINAKNTIEIGVFTGHSLLATALSLPDDGKVMAIDPDIEAYNVGLPFIRKAGVEHKIQFLQGSALPILNDFIDKGEEGKYDFAFIDADKESYIKYHEQLLKLVKIGGVIAYDNTLFFGSVACPDDVVYFNDDDPAITNGLENIRKAIKNFNQFLAADPHIESTLVSIGDGLTLCRRKY